MPASLVDHDPARNLAAGKLPQYIVVVSVTLTAFSIGNYLSWSSPALLFYRGRDDELRMNGGDESWMCSLLPLGAVVSTLPAGMIADNIGRKRAVLITAIPLLLCWFLIAFAGSKIWVFLARFVGGLACGAASVIVPMYVSEIAEDNTRGSLGTIFQIQITLGILFTYTMGLTNNFLAITLPCVLAPALLLIIYPTLPESPAWLIAQGRRGEADYALKRLRGSQYRTEEEITKLERNCENRIGEACFLELRHYAKGTIIILGLMMFQQLSGVNAIIFYAEEIWNKAIKSISPAVCSVLVGSVQVTATLCSAFLIERTGRKFLLFISISVMAICMLLLSGYFHFQRTHDVSQYEWIPVLSCAVFIIVFSIGFGPIPWVMTGELFTNNVKSAASSAAAICNWFFAFLVINCFQYMADALGMSSSFGVFGIIGLAGTVFVAALVPETKGKTIEQVQIELYKKPNRRREGRASLAT